MMKAVVKITNEDLYHAKVADVELNNLKYYNGAFHGNVAIEIENEGWREFDGEHGESDFKDDYGFKIIRDDN